MTAALSTTCWRCGGTLFVPDEDYGRRCVLCGRAQLRYVWMPKPLPNDGERAQAWPVRQCVECGAGFVADRANRAQALYCARKCSTKATAQRVLATKRALALGMGR